MQYWTTFFNYLFNQNFLMENDMRKTVEIMYDLIIQFIGNSTVDFISYSTVFVYVMIFQFSVP